MTALWTALTASRGAKIALAVLLLIVAGLALYLWAMSHHDETVQTAVQQGREAQQRDDALETLNTVKEANDARSAVNDAGSRARYDECLRSARNPANCQRFLPE